MFIHRTYKENSDDFTKMCSLVTYLNSKHISDWSLGRMYGWKYGKWTKESQIDEIFEQQAELFFGDSDELCGIIITENLGENYYILTDNDEDIIHNMITFLSDNNLFSDKNIRVICTNSDYLQNCLMKYEFNYCRVIYSTYVYEISNIVIHVVSIPYGYTLSLEQEYTDKSTVEKLRFFAFNPNGIYNNIIDNAYKYNRNNPILIPELCIILLNEIGEPISTCIGLYDNCNRSMEVEVVVTKKEYENRGFAKIVISECIKRGIAKGVNTVRISAWEDKTKILYSSFGKYQEIKTISYMKEI